MGRAYRDLFSPTRLPQIYWKNLLDLTVCKIANSDVDGGNSGICPINQELPYGVNGKQHICVMTGYNPNVP
jgi:hypothetical protein